MLPNRFNVRVYFLLHDAAGMHVLVSDEIIHGNAFTKFPGGGLEFGEGPVDCVRREALEELGQEVQVTGHFYTTEFFVQSAFRSQDQVLSIYYTAQLKEEPRFRTSERPFDFVQTEKDEESFRWVRIRDLQEADFHFPIDREVVRRLLAAGA